MRQQIKIVFVSNYMNHHQLTISQEFSKVAEYYFIATEPVPQERLNFGYKDMNSEYDFVIRAYESKTEYAKLIELIDTADVVIFGDKPENFKLIHNRVEENKLTFRYSERLFKNKKLIRMFHPKAILNMYKTATRYKNNNYYLLCSSAYAKQDYAWFNAFKGKTFKWGYFPNINKFEEPIEKVVDTKMQGNIILWCGRFIDWKHPEYAIYCAQELIKEGIDFQIHMVGNGPLLENMKSKVQKLGLENQIKIVGSLPFDKVQEEMKKAKIFLFTSDQNEGWGAVLNESMGNACCVIANKNIGSAPYMVEDTVNGYLYSNKKEFLQKVKLTMTNCKATRSICKNAYETVHTKWNAVSAVENFMKLVGAINSNNIDKIDNSNTPCAKA